MVLVCDIYGFRFEVSSFMPGLCNPLKLCFKETNSAGFKWSFNRCIRSSQEPTGQIVQKFQANYGSENRCMATANRFAQTGSVLMLYPCERTHPGNACFKFKEGRS